MRYHNIERCSLVNGPGVRTVLWVAGCEHMCPGCQNPCTWDSNGGIFFDAKAEAELFDYLSNKYCQGITFSGGDPLHHSNRDEIGRLAKKVKDLYPQKDIWLYTGYTWSEILDLDLEWLSFIDVVVEGRFVLEKRNVELMWRGSDNQNVVSVKESKERGELVPYCL